MIIESQVLECVYEGKDVNFERFCNGVSCVFASLDRPSIFLSRLALSSLSASHARAHANTNIHFPHFLFPSLLPTFIFLPTQHLAHIFFVKSLPLERARWQKNIANDEVMDHR